MHADCFTGILKEISNLIGISDTLKLVKQFGGLSIYLPKEFSENHELACAVGIESALKIYNYFGPVGAIEIPKAHSLAISFRNNKIKEERQSHSRKSLARKYCLTERQITNILHTENHQTDPNQLNLF
jgi:Mor family transcriptional regulator